MKLLEDVLLVNMVLRNRKEERLRIIWISENEDNLYLINIDDNKWQYSCSKFQIKQELNNKEIEVINDDIFIVAEDDINESAKRIRDKYFNIVNFVSKIDSLIGDTDPRIYIYVGDRRFNFNRLNPNIETIYDTKITEGFRIEYKGKIYDYSI